MGIKNSLMLKNSRYVSGGMSEGTSNTIDWWERKIFKPDATDIEYVVEFIYANKIDALDNIAFAFYNDPSLWWVIAQYNNILDPVTEIVPGLILLIPTAIRVKTDFLTGALGGKPTTRLPIPNIMPIVV